MDREPAVDTSVVAVLEEVTYADASLADDGARVGNGQIEPFVTVAASAAPSTYPTTGRGVRRRPISAKLVTTRAREASRNGRPARTVDVSSTSSFSGETVMPHRHGACSAVALMVLAAAGATTAPALAEPTGPSPIVALDIDDPRGDIALEWAGGPSFRPAAATDAGDIAWVRTIPHGDDVTVQVKVEDVFVYARDYHRSGDDRSSSSAGQRAVIGYDGVTAEIDTDPSGTGLRVRHTYIADRYVQQPCERDAVLAFSRVHDLIAVTLPMECTDAYEPPFRGTVYVLTTTAATHVATRGDRTVSTSFRYYRDKVLTEIPT